MWRFLGIQSKNRAEWALSHWGNMHTRTTTIALYDTLGEDAFKYVVNQTELITIACSQDMIEKIARMKMDDDKSEGQMKLFRLKYIISFDDEVNAKAKDLVRKAGLEVMTFSFVIE